MTNQPKRCLTCGGHGGAEWNDGDYMEWDENLPCPACGKTGLATPAEADNYTPIPGVLFKCEYCNERYGTIAWLKRHVVAKHTPQPEPIVTRRKPSGFDKGFLLAKEGETDDPRPTMMSFESDEFRAFEYGTQPEPAAERHGGIKLAKGMTAEDISAQILCWAGYIKSGGNWSRRIDSNHSEGLGVFEAKSNLDRAIDGLIAQERRAAVEAFAEKLKHELNLDNLRSQMSGAFSPMADEIESTINAALKEAK